MDCRRVFRRLVISPLLNGEYLFKAFWAASKEAPWSMPPPCLKPLMPGVYGMPLAYEEAGMHLGHTNHEVCCVAKRHFGAKMHNG
jgi:hypothetical protein